MRYDVSVIGLYILDVLGRPVARIPDGGNVDFIEEIRPAVAGIISFDHTLQTMKSWKIKS